MKLEQDLRQRLLDGKWEVWQKLSVRWNVVPCDAQEEADVFVLHAPDWLPVAVFPTKDAAIRFWNACFLANKALAPESAGDGSGSSLREPWISALNANRALTGDERVTI